MKDSSESMLSERIGPYRIVSRLAKGGMGEIYRGYDERLDRPVAMKRILAANATSERLRERFRREAKMVARLSHPSIVQVFDWLEVEGENWLIMELIDGVPLNDAASSRQLTLHQQVACALGIAEGLEAAHGEGIIHRDLKLSNVMLTADGVKILDFGIAKSMRRTGAEEMVTLTEEGVVMGSLASISPEQALGQKVDHRSDLFSLGALIYELVTGKAPFKAKNASETLIRIYSWEHLPIEERRPEAPYALCRLVDRLLEKEPANRPVDASRVVADLERVVQGLGGRSSRIFKALEDSDASADPSAEQTLPHGLDLPSTDLDLQQATYAPPDVHRDLSAADSSSTGSAPSDPSISDPVPSDPGPSDRSMSSGATTDVAVPRPRRGSGRARGVAAMVAVVLALSVVWWLSQGHSEPELGAGEPHAIPAATDGVDEELADAAAVVVDKARIAVLPFENRTGELEWDPLGLVVADWLGRQLSGDFELAPLELVVQALESEPESSPGSSSESGLGSDGVAALDLDTDVAQIAADTGAGTLLKGAFYRSDDELIVRVQIQDALSQRLVAVLEPMRMARADAPAGLGLVEPAVRAALATAESAGDLSSVETPSAGPSAVAAAEELPDFDSYAAYVDGLRRFWSGQVAEALVLFERSAELTPRFAPPRLMAAVASSRLGRPGSSARWLDDLESRRAQLTSFERLRFDRLKAVSHGDFGAAADFAASAASQEPLTQWPWVLAVDALRANQPRRALDALARLHPAWLEFDGVRILTSPHALHPSWTSAGIGSGVGPGPGTGACVSYFVLSAEALHLAAEFEEGLRVAEQGRKRCGLAASLFAVEARGLAALGRVQEAEVLLQEAPGAARSLVAFELATRGDTEQARTVAEQALDAFRRHPRPSAEDREWEAHTLFFLARDEQAEVLYQGLIQDHPERVDLWGYLAVTALRLGRVQEAEAWLEKLRQETADGYGERQAALAAVHAWRGERAAATELLREALSRGYPTTWPRMHPSVDPIWQPLRDHSPFLEAITPRG